MKKGAMDKLKFSIESYDSTHPSIDYKFNINPYTTNESTYTYNVVMHFIHFFNSLGTQTKIDPDSFIRAVRLVTGETDEENPSDEDVDDFNDNFENMK